METPGPVEDTNPVEESRMALEGSHEAGNLAVLLGQNAGSVGKGSMGESTVAVETSEALADEVVVAETAAAAVAVDSAGPAEKVGRGFAAAPVDSEFVAPTTECRLGEHSACKQWSELWGGPSSFQSKNWILKISEGRQRKCPHGCALSVVQFVFFIRDTSSSNGKTLQTWQMMKPNGIHPAHNAVRSVNLPQVSLDHQAPEVAVQAFPAPARSSDP